MKWPLGVLIGLSLAGGAEAQAEFSPLFSGEASAQFGPALEQPTLRVEGGTEFEGFGLHARMLAGLAATGGRTFGGETEAWAAWGGDYGNIRAGWWPEPRGPALFRSVIPVFASAPATEILSTAGNALPRSPFKASVEATVGEWTAVVESATWQTSVETPDTASPWFPRKDIPVEFSNSALGTYTLNTLSISPEETKTSWDRLPVRASLRWSALWGDATAGYFHGMDDQVVFPYRVTMPLALEYDITLTPQRNLVDAGWISAEIPWGSGKIWTEQRITRNRLRLEGGLQAISSGALLQSTSTSDVWESVAGASTSVSLGFWGTLRFWAEGNLYRDGSSPWGTAPDFSQSAEGGGHWDLPRDLGALDLMVGSPWDAYQGWIWGRATWNWTEGRTVWIGAPWFWGPAGSAWGQYADRRLVAVGSTWEQ